MEKKWKVQLKRKRETLEERKFMNQHTNLARKNMNQTIQDVYLWAFHPQNSERKRAKEHTPKYIAESIWIIAN